MKVNKNDTVLVVSGNDKGKKGKVLKVFPVKERIIVEGVHFIKRHTKKSNKNPQGGIVEKEGSINASNVMVICGRCNKPTRIGRKRLEDGKHARICKKCNEMIATSA
jgi:large subunit ribosomal protein L24